MKHPEVTELRTWRRLVSSTTVREQQVAFTCATGLPLTLVPASTLALADETLMVTGCLGGHSGEICQDKLLQAEKRALIGPHSVQFCCPSGLMKILVPIFVGKRHLGSLLAGPFSLHWLDEARLQRLTALLDKVSLSGCEEELETAWKHSPLLSWDKCRSAATLLQIFGKYLEEKGEQFLQLNPADRSIILAEIEAFLAECKQSPSSLKEISGRINSSTCHFCSVFKKQTGLAFAQYRTRQNLERACEFLVNSEHRISEIALDCGFESIPYFNRVFRRQYGCSPSTYRAQLADQMTGQKNPAMRRNESIVL